MTSPKRILFTGGSGKAGKHVIAYLLDQGHHVLNVDLTPLDNPKVDTLFADITQSGQMFNALTSYSSWSDLDSGEGPPAFDAIVHFAAESHVDRSIHGPGEFIQTNIVGTFHLLEAARDYWMQLEDAEKANFRFLHVSTDEVYGTLTASDAPFTEQNRYEPNSPYSASKAASDHLVRAWHHTYGLPVLTTNCSNNYGPYHFPEKLIPLTITNALAGKPLPIYGDGLQVRDWLYVGDHCSGIRRVLEAGTIGETYNIGGWNEQTNISIVQKICALLDERRPRADGTSYATQITHVKDRPGHDRRYAIDARKIEQQLGWRPAETFETGIRKTVDWYLENAEWVTQVQSGAYRDWVNKQYGETV